MEIQHQLDVDDNDLSTKISTHNTCIEHNGRHRTFKKAGGGGKLDMRGGAFILPPPPPPPPPPYEAPRKMHVQYCLPLSLTIDATPHTSVN